MGSRALVPRAWRRDHGLHAARPRQHARQSHAGRDRPTQWRNPGADRARLAVARGGDDRDPESIAARACAREPRCARYRAYGRRSDRARPRLPATNDQELSRYALTALVSLRAAGRFASLAAYRPGTQSGTAGWPV